MSSHNWCKLIPDDKDFCFSASCSGFLGFKRISTSPISLDHKAGADLSFGMADAKPTKPKRTLFSIWSSMLSITDFLSGYRKDTPKKIIPSPAQAGTKLRCSISHSSCQRHCGLRLSDQTKSEMSESRDLAVDRRFSVATNSDSGLDSLPCYESINNLTARRPHLEDELNGIFYVHGPLDAHFNDHFLRERSGFADSFRNSIPAYNTNTHVSHPREQFHIGSTSSIDSGWGSELTRTHDAPSSSFTSSESSPSTIVTHNESDGLASMSDWLRRLGLSEYHSAFIQNGICMAIMHKLTPQDLIAIGVTNSLHRKIMRNSISKLIKAHRDQPDYFYRKDLKGWLESLQLGSYYPGLYSQGFHTLEQLSEISAEDLDDIGIQKLGHQIILSTALKKLKASMKNGKVIKDPMSTEMKFLYDLPIVSNADMYFPSPRVDDHRNSISDIDTIINNIRRDLDAMVAYKSVSNV